MGLKLLGAQAVLGATQIQKVSDEQAETADKSECHTSSKRKVQDSKASRQNPRTGKKLSFVSRSSFRLHIQRSHLPPSDLPRRPHQLVKASDTFDRWKLELIHTHRSSHHSAVSTACSISSFDTSLSHHFFGHIKPNRDRPSLLRLPATSSV